MPSGRALRHAALFLLFLALLLLGVLREDVFDDAENSHAGEARELRQEPHGLFTLLFSSRAQYRATPLTLDRHDFPHATDAFVAEYVNRTTPPQLRDVTDARTPTAFDFLEELQMWRLPGRAGARVAELTDAQRMQERAAARAEARRNRGRKSWKTRRGEGGGGSLLRFIGLGPSGGAAAGGVEDGGSGVVEVHYPAEAVLHCSGCNATGSSFSLTSDDVELVPYPWVPAPPPPSPFTASPETTTTAAVTGGNSTHTTVRISKGKVHFAVPHRATPHTPTHGWHHFYIALNLWKNEEVLPDLTEALIVFLVEELQPLFDLATSVVVAIYANVSPDRTAELIDSLLIPRLHAIGVRAVYATTEGACLGYVEPQPFHERIEWMACIRNKALAPLYELGMQAFLPSPTPPQSHAPRGGPTTRSPQAAAHIGTGGDDADGRDGLVVLFFNDIFFRPQDITTLLESRAEPRMAAAVQPHGWRSSTTAAADDAELHGTRRRAAEPAVVTALPATPATTFDMACGMDFYFTFYDTWVTRDRLGQPFAAQMPYSDDRATQDAFYRILNHERSSSAHSRGEIGAAAPAPEAMSIPVKCCWNGVAAIRGRFFLPPTPAHRVAFPATAGAGEGEEAVAEAAVPVRVEGRSARGRGTQRGAAAIFAAVTVKNGAAAVDGVELQERTLAAALRRTSGAVYDRIGSVQEVLRQTRLQRYYTRVLARRLQSECAAWTSTRREIAEVNGVPFYVPERCANSTSFEATLAAVIAEVQEGGGQDTWTNLRLQPASATPSSTVAEQEDGVYYRARHPTLRFRHAFTPSYGAAVHGQRPVRDDVCLSSECLLICQDVMQAALVQDGRAPIILLNPHVRVAYDLDHFARVTRHTWFFEHPYVYWAWTLARRAQLWWEQLSSTSTPRWWRGAESGGAGGLRELGEATSATDDWLKEPHTAASQQMHATITVRDGAGRATARGIVDVPTLTRMDCQRITAGSIEFVLGGLFPLARLGQLLVVALLLRWWCWQAQADVTAAAAGRGGGGEVEQRCWRAVYHAVWYSWAAQRARRGLDAITAAAQRGGSAASARGSEPRGRGEVEGGGFAGYDEAEGTGDGLYTSSGSGKHGRAARANSPPTLLQLAYRLRRDTSPKLLRMARSSRWIGGGGCCSRAVALVRRGCVVVAHAVLWLLASLCCVRLWCGCRPPPPPFVGPDSTARPSALLQQHRGPRRSLSPPVAPEHAVADGFGRVASPLASGGADGRPFPSGSPGRAGSPGTGDALSPPAVAVVEGSSARPAPWRGETPAFRSPISSAMQQQVRPRTFGVPGSGSSNTGGSGGARTPFTLTLPPVAQAGPHMPATPSPGGAAPSKARGRALSD